MPLQKVIDSIRQSLWFVPALWVLGCGMAAFGMVAIDRTAPGLPNRIALVFAGGPEGARGLLSAIASSMITVVGVVFSITIVALQLASSQYSPRVLRNFMRDRVSQMTLGSLIGAFVYSLLVLRTVRAPGSGGGEFVPALAVTGAVLLAVVAVGMLVYFMHHIAQRMQAAHITESVAQETLVEIARQDEAYDGVPSDRPDAGRPTEAGIVVKADRSGYLQYLEIESLVRVAQENAMVIGVLRRPGDWVQHHGPLFETWGAHATDELEHALRHHVSVGSERVIYQDPDFGVQQLADIAVKALSPGINDPTTARNALDRLTQVLTAAGRNQLTGEEHVDGDGVVRLIVPRAAFRDLMRTAFEGIHHFGRDIPSVARALRRSLDTLEESVRTENRAAVVDARRRYCGR